MTGSLLGDAGRALARFRNAAPAPLSAPGGLGLANLFTGTDQYLRAMGASGLVNAIVNGLAEPTAGVRWHLYRSAESGKPEDRREVLRHQALKVWNRPNDFMTGTTFRHSVIQHLKLVGESEWMVAYAPGTRIPTELWPVRPDRMVPDPHPTEFIVGWTYKAPGGATVPLGLDEVIQVKVPNPEDPYRGLGVVQSIMADIDSSRSAAQWAAHFFINNARPGGVVEIPGSLGQPQFEQLVDRWNYAHRGVRNANRVAFLEGGAKYVGGQFTQKDMQFVEWRKATSEVIREAFRFPVPMLGTVDSVNRANAEAAELMMARWLVVPLLDMLRDVLNTSYLPLFGDTALGLEFDYDSPVAADREGDNAELTAKVEAYVKLVASGVNTDDASDVVGLPRMKRVAPAVTPPTPPTGGQASGRQHPVNGPRRVTGEADPRESDPTYQQFLTDLDELLSAWSEVSADLRADLVATVRTALDADDPEALASITVDSSAGATEIEAALAVMYAHAADLAVAEAAEAGFEVEAPEPDGGAVALMNSLSICTAAVLASALVTSAIGEATRLLAAGQTNDEIVSGVATYLGELTDAYPTQKLGGALWGAANAGRIDTAEASGLKVVFVADEKLDRNTCKPCRDIDGAVYYSATAMRADGYGFGGFTSCLGRDRCRGFARVAWNGETA